MKIAFTKTTILSLCVVLGLTIGISSAFGQKLADQSQVKGEMPPNQANEILNKQLVPEHLKPEKQESEPQDSPQVKGEKPVDTPQGSLNKRLAPENSQPQDHHSSEVNSEQPEKEQPDTQTNKPKQEESQTQKPPADAPTQEKTESEQKPTGKQERKKDEQASQETQEDQGSTHDQSQDKQPQTNQSESNSSVEHEPSPSKEEQQPTESPTDTKTKQEQNELEIPEMKVENSKGETIDVTSVIEDIFGDVNSAKEDTEKIQEQMKNHDLLAQNQVENQPSKKQEEFIAGEEDENNPPRTIKHGKMPMTASNDLQGVLIGLLIAAVGVLYVLFRKGDQR